MGFFCGSGSLASRLELTNTNISFLVGSGEKHSPLVVTIVSNVIDTIRFVTAQDDTIDYEKIFENFLKTNPNTAYIIDNFKNHNKEKKSAKKIFGDHKESFADFFVKMEAPQTIVKSQRTAKFSLQNLINLVIDFYKDPEIQRKIIGELEKVRTKTGKKKTHFSIDKIRKLLPEEPKFHDKLFQNLVQKLSAKELAKFNLDRSSKIDGDSSDRKKSDRISDSELLEKGKKLQISTFYYMCVRGNLTEIRAMFEAMKKDGNPEYVNFQAEDGRTGLFFAADQGHTEVVKFLLTIENININASDTDGDTALSIAEKRNNFEVAEIINQFLKSTKTPIDDLFAGASELDVGDDDPFLEAELIAAASSGDVQKFTKFLTEPAVKEVDRVSLLLVAARNGHFEIVKVLKDYINSIVPESSFTPLITAINEGNIKMVEILLEAGADVDSIVKSDIGKTAVEIAIAKNAKEIISLLLPYTEASAEQQEVSDATSEVLDIIFKKEDDFFKYLQKIAQIKRPVVNKKFLYDVVAKFEKLKPSFSATETEIELLEHFLTEQSKPATLVKTALSSELEKHDTKSRDRY